MPAKNCLVILLFANLLLVPRSALAESACPEVLVRALQGHAPDCKLLIQERLESRQGNSDVVVRIYRWISTLRELPRPLFDEAPYNQVAATLSLADTPTNEAFWARQYWLGMAWFERPFLVRNKKYGEFLIVPARFTGTGSFRDDHVLVPTLTGEWKPINSAQLDQETGLGWARQLQESLPEGFYLAKGILLDYETLTGESDVWRSDDPNCCPTGGRIWFQLKLTELDVRFEVDRARYMPERSN